MALLECILAISILSSGGVALLCRKSRTAVLAYLCMALLLAVLWGIQYGLSLAADLLIGIGITGLLFFVSLRQMKEGSHDE